MKKALSTCVIIIVSGLALNAKTIWQDKNPYASAGNIRVGTVIVVTVNDITDMRFNLTLGSRVNSTVSSNPDVTITGFLPKVSANRKFSDDDTTQFTGRGKFSFSIATRVLNRVGAMLNVAGSRTYTFNGVTNIVTVTGLVDPALLKGKSIDSSNVVDFTLELRGVRQGINIARPPLKQGETASSSLTEQEKQQIITDYLRKMLGELTK